MKSLLIAVKIHFCYFHPQKLIKHTIFDISLADDHTFTFQLASRDKKFKQTFTCEWSSISNNVSIKISLFNHWTAAKTPFQSQENPQKMKEKLQQNFCFLLSPSLTLNLEAQQVVISAASLFYFFILLVVLSTNG